MRILHFSDLHIGVENYGRIDLETGLSTRLGDFLDSLDQVVEFALNEGVDLVLLAGDAYKGRDPTQTHQREFAKRLNRLSQAGIPTFLLVGNHDLPAASSRATAVDIFPTLEVANVPPTPPQTQRERKKICQSTTKSIVSMATNQTRKRPKPRRWKKRCSCFHASRSLSSIKPSVSSGCLLMAVILVR